jgi:pseudoazurin
MRKGLIAGAVMLALAGAAADAKTIEVQMLNRGEAGAMVFQPNFVKAEPGDVIHFVAKDKGHNVESVDGMLPEGVAPFAGKLNHDFELTVDKPGIYGVKCKPHYMLGMVALIEVGDPVNLEAAKAARQKGRAKQAFAKLFAEVQ